MVETVQLEGPEPVRLGDGLELALLGISHKRPRVGGPQKEWATIRLTKDGASSEIDLAHRIDPDGREEWDRLGWGAYTVELTEIRTSSTVFLVVRRS